MFYTITYMLFKLRLIQPSEKAILFWKQHSDILKLEYALVYGNYKVRKLAAEALAEVGNCASAPILLKTINDSVHNVSVAALNALEKLNCDASIQKIITRKRFLWNKNIQDKAEKFEKNKGKTSNIYRWERASKKSFEMVKERLKRPIR